MFKNVYTMAERASLDQKTHYLGENKNGNKFEIDYAMNVFKVNLDENKSKFIFTKTEKASLKSSLEENYKKTGIRDKNIKSKQILPDQQKSQDNKIFIQKRVNKDAETDKIQNHIGVNTNIGVNSNNFVKIIHSEIILTNNSQNKNNHDSKKNKSNKSLMFSQELDTKNLLSKVNLKEDSLNKINNNNHNSNENKHTANKMSRIKHSRSLASSPLPDIVEGNFLLIYLIKQ